MGAAIQCFGNLPSNIECYYTVIPYIYGTVLKKNKVEFYIALDRFLKFGINRRYIHIPMTSRFLS